MASTRGRFDDMNIIIVVHSALTAGFYRIDRGRSTLISPFVAQ